jgi:leucyl aminopeptidase
MNTKVKIVKTFNKKENLVVLAEKANLAWAADYLGKEEIQYLKNAIKNEISQVVFPKGDQIIVVQILKMQGTDAEQREEARIFGAEMLHKLENYKAKKITVVNKRKSNHVLDFIEGMILANYQFLKYFSDKKEMKNHLETIQITQEVAPAKELKDLIATCEAVYVARDFVNEPLSYLTAAQMSIDIKKLGKECGFKVTVFDEKKIKQLKMGGIIAVNRGSFTPPRFNILEYKPKQKAKNSKPIVLVGKGVVYDTGGVSLKPTANSMDRMKADMGGAASVIGTFVAAAKAKLPLHLIGLIPATDNRPGNNAYVPGDVIKMYDGSTVEVLNTDAEGRMILADALHYAKKYKPELVLDFATLTGAAVRSCGTEGMSMMSTADEKIKNKIKSSGFNVHERIIEFPLWKEYGEQIKSNIADIKNLGGPYAGHITAAKFLEHFTGKAYPWVHFDIAGHAFLTRANAYRPKEGTGAGVRLMFDFLKNY